MNGIGTYPIVGTTRPGGIVGWGSFNCNGASTPASTTFLGSLKNRFTVAYSATGIFTVTLSSGLSFPENPVILVASQCADNTGTNQFWVCLTGSYSNTNRQFVIQANQGTSAFAPPATTGNRIAFYLGIVNSTGL